MLCSRTHYLLICSPPGSHTGGRGGRPAEAVDGAAQRVRRDQHEAARRRGPSAAGAGGVHRATAPPDGRQAVPRARDLLLQAAAGGRGEQVRVTSISSSSRASGILFYSRHLHGQ